MKTMSELDDMIKRLCPDGVEFVKLGEVMDISRGASPRPIYKYITEDKDGVNWIKIGDVENNAKYITSTKEKITKEGALKSRFLHKGDFILSNSMSFGRPYILAIDGCIHDGWISMSNFQNVVIPDFLYHILKSFNIQQYWRQRASSGTVSNLNADIVRNTEIPLPPLEIQAEIVRILDKFTKLEAELEAELDCRKRQYEFYRDQLLSFDKLTPSERNNIVWKKLSEVGTFIRGKRFVRTDIVEQGVPCIHYGDIYTYYGLTAHTTRTCLLPEKAEKMRFAQKNDVIIVAAGENNMDIGVGVAWLGEEKVAVHDACFIFRSELNPRYLSHFLRSSDYHLQIKKYVSEGKICSISAQNLGKAVIAIPSLEEQERRANVLDRFEALTTSLQHGLPAEITARRQQYEYYRDKLLDFKRKNVQTESNKACF